ncbi:MAG: hypothetical protein ACYC0X_02360 [Pirellulaceae bacterium]
MTWMTCVLASLLAQQPNSGELWVELELASSNVRLGDPLFAKVAIINKSSETVRVPSDLFRTTGYSVTPDRSPYSYRFLSEHVTGSISTFPVGPGNTRVIDYETLEFPRIEEWKHDFWRTNLSQYAAIRPHVGCSSKNVNKLLPRMESSFSLTINERAPDEMEFLAELYTESVRRNQQNVEATGWKELGSNPGTFGLHSFHPYPDLVRKLVAYEEQLSPGSLRDIVHLVRLTQLIFHSEGEPDKQKAVAELLAWLDTLPEIERHCLAMQILSWAGNTAPAEPALYELVLGVMQRLPQQLYEFQDYRKYRLDEYAGSHPQFRDYIKRQDPFAF